MDHNIPLIPYHWEIYVYMYHPHGNEYIEAGRRNCSRLCIPVDIKILYQQDEKVKIKTLLKKVPLHRSCSALNSLFSASHHHLAGYFKNQEARQGLPVGCTEYHG